MRLFCGQQMMACLVVLVIGLAPMMPRNAAAQAAKPMAWVNDDANVLSESEEQALNATLRDFEAADSTQVFVAIMPRLPVGESVETFTNDLFARWKIGQKNRDNGVLLAIFVNDRQLRIEVGYGLEDRLTDARSKLIIASEIAPSLKQGNYYQGVKNGVEAIISACRGAYAGTGASKFSLLSLARLPGQIIVFIINYWVVIAVVIIVLHGMFSKNVRRTQSWSSHSRHSHHSPSISFPTSHSSGSSSSSSSGGFSDFSGGGGGRSGGGGASGSW